MVIDEAKAEVLYPEHAEYCQTQDFCITLAVELTTCEVLELIDPRKTLSQSLSVKQGKSSWTEISDENKKRESQYYDK